MRDARIALCLVALVTACSTREDVRTRYQLERMIWQAQFYQRRINISFISASRQDTRQAIEAYRRVVAADPFAAGPQTGWDPGVSADIRELLVTARVALANLYFASERYTDAATLYEETLRLGSISFKDVLETRLGAARSSYMEGDNARVIAQCENIFHEVSASNEFWAGKGDIDEVFMNIPVSVVRLQRAAGNAAGTDSSATAALAFYQRVTKTWPKTKSDWQARLAIAQLHMIRDEWRPAADALREILADPAQQAGDAASLELVLGEVLAFHLSDLAGGKEHFVAVQKKYPETVAAWAAAYNLAAMRQVQGDTAGAAEGYRTLERARGAPDAVASRAMLARARLLEASGSWDAAFALLRRVEELYPFTPAAIEAPLLVTRHYVAAGNQEMTEVAVAHAREFYNSLLDRGSAFPGNRAVVQSALAASFVASGRAGEGATILAEGSRSWDEASTAAGMFKAAELYRTVLNDPAEARATLEKIIARFPETRYARIARERIAEISPGS